MNRMHETNAENMSDGMSAGGEREGSESRLSLLSKVSMNSDLGQHTLLRHELNQKELDVYMLTTRLAWHEKILSERDQMLTRKSDEIEDLKQKNQTHIATIHLLETQVQKERAKVLSLSSQKAHLKSLLEDVRARGKEDREKARSLEARMEQIEEKNLHLVQNMDSGMLGELCQEIKSLRARISTMNAEPNFRQILNNQERILLNQSGLEDTVDTHHDFADVKQSLLNQERLIQEVLDRSGFEPGRARPNNDLAHLSQIILNQEKLLAGRARVLSNQEKLLNQPSHDLAHLKQVLLNQDKLLGQMASSSKEVSSILSKQEEILNGQDTKHEVRILEESRESELSEVLANQQRLLRAQGALEEGHRAHSARSLACLERLAQGQEGAQPRLAELVDTKRVVLQELQANTTNLTQIMQNQEKFLGSEGCEKILQNQEALLNRTNEMTEIVKNEAASTMAKAQENVESSRNGSNINEAKEPGVAEELLANQRRLLELAEEADSRRLVDALEQHARHAAGEADAMLEQILRKLGERSETLGSLPRMLGQIGDNILAKQSRDLTDEVEAILANQKVILGETHSISPKLLKSMEVLDSSILDKIARLENSVAVILKSSKGQNDNMESVMQSVDRLAPIRDQLHNGLGSLTKLIKSRDDLFETLHENLRARDEEIGLAFSGLATRDDIHSLQQLLPLYRHSVAFEDSQVRRQSVGVAEKPRLSVGYEEAAPAGVGKASPRESIMLDECRRSLGECVLGPRTSICADDLQRSADSESQLFDSADALGRAASDAEDDRFLSAQQGEITFNESFGSEVPEVTQAHIFDNALREFRVLMNEMHSFTKDNEVSQRLVEFGQTLADLRTPIQALESVVRANSDCLQTHFDSALDKNSQTVVRAFETQIPEWRQIHQDVIRKIQAIDLQAFGRQILEALELQHHRTGSQVPFWFCVILSVIIPVLVLRSYSKFPHVS